jgi:hypothetical protein
VSSQEVRPGALGIEFRCRSGDYVEENEKKCMREEIVKGLPLVGQSKSRKAATGTMALGTYHVIHAGAH